MTELVFRGKERKSWMKSKGEENNGKRWWVKNTENDETLLITGGKSQTSGLLKSITIFTLLTPSHQSFFQYFTQTKQLLVQILFHIIDNVMILFKLIKFFHYRNWSTCNMCCLCFLGLLQGSWTINDSESQFEPPDVPSNGAASLKATSLFHLL